MSRLTLTVTIDFVDDDELDNFAGPITDGLTDHLSDVMSNNPFIVDFLVEEV
jgi:hypothetical protein